LITVLFVTGQLGLGGGEKQLYLVLKYIDRKIINPVVISFNPGVGDFWEKPIESLGIDIFFVKKSKNKLKRFFDFFLLVNRIKPTIIQSWSVYYNFFVALVGIILKIPIKVGAVRQNLFIKGKRKRSTLYSCRSTTGLDYFITNSTKGQEDLVKLGINNEKIYLIYNAIEYNPDDFDDYKKEDIRKQWGVATDELIIGTIGSLKWEKNYPFMLKLISSLCKKHNNIRLVIYGEGQERHAIGSLAEDLKIVNKVLLLGQKRYASKEIHASDIFLFTSLSEGMPNALIEASLAGLPIVTSNIGGAHDIVIHGKTGFICDDYSFHEFLYYLTLLIEDKEKCLALGQAGKHFVSDKFHISVIRDQFNSFYKDIGNYSK
jgi:glycosyltransferase involved in cell wall biosynthesis